MTTLTRRSFGALIGASATTLATPGLLRANSTGRLVIIGGGFGGASAARFARINYPDVDVTLVEPYPTFVTCPYGNLILGGKRTLPQITHSYDGLRARGVNVVQDRAADIDPDARTVALESGASLQYDKLIVSPGIGLRWGAIDGYDQAATEVFPHAWMGGDGSQITNLRAQLEALPEGGVVGLAIPENPFRCPPGPYERISMIAHYLKQTNPTAKILAFDSKEGFSKQGLFEDVWAELYGDMIEWIPANQDGRIVAVDVQNKLFISEFGEEHRVDVGNVIPPQTSAAIVRDTGLANDTGWVPVNSRTFEADAARDIHVIGDATIAGPMPKSGYIANSTSKTAVSAALADLTGGSAPSDPVYFNTCYSHGGEDYGISVVAVFRATDDGFEATPDSGGLSPRGPLSELAENRRLEARYADAWYDSITRDMFS
ncbi:FAD-dependent oxidoreductase [Rhodobacteraceae bacterium 2376]|uniref:FAD-dependent oxidoreductase n=1 Tax=Rhabdonatronobacter sediminivivens TaxID=2743469 RepID=A0A7Z0KY32_9RHOB|nr:NAD(P)/FAD-dependent oxidoreductase [Rhabdonatronobacter sediminivivens]NYS24860.1 FAD-dependent oxidoreductase [Rhabdonatronobacter sediminivivens]